VTGKEDDTRRALAWFKTKPLAYQTFAQAQGTIKAAAPGRARTVAECFPLVSAAIPGAAALQVGQPAKLDDAPETPPVPAPVMPPPQARLGQIRDPIAAQTPFVAAMPAVKSPPAAPVMPPRATVPETQAAGELRQIFQVLQGLPPDRTLAAETATPVWIKMLLKNN
jgi:hypothetical protein